MPSTRPTRQRLALRVARVVLSAGLAGTTVLTTLPAASAADPVKEAEALVARMNAKVEATTARLLAGEKRYQDGSARLAEVRRQATSARKAAARAESATSASRERLKQFAAAAYRNPLPSTLLATIAATDGETFRRSMLASADLDQALGSQEDALLGLLADQVRARTLVQAADSLEADARKRERALKRELDGLAALAVATDAELQAANARLDRLVAARRAAALAALRAQRARSSSSFVSCTGRPVGGYSNGNIPSEALCPLRYTRDHRLRADAAKAFNALTEASKASRGVPLCVTDSYRSYSEQVALYRRKPGLAATPGTSNHGWGVAVDLCGGVERFGSDAHEWMRANAPRFGWVHPSWARQGGSKPEAWHWEYTG